MVMVSRNSSVSTVDNHYKKPCDYSHGFFILQNQYKRINEKNIKKHFAR